MMNELKKIAEVHGTPCYVYDFNKIASRLIRLKKTLNKNVRLYYAVKANPNIILLKHLKPFIDGLDISSGGELKQALIAGYDPKNISFAGAGKTKSEIEFAIQNNCGTLSAESLDELIRIINLSKKNKIKTNICFRINPEKAIDKFSIKMGGRPTQFGFEENDIEDGIKLAKQHAEFVNIIGFHIYSGTQCLETKSLVDNTEQILQLVYRLGYEFNIIPQIINIGGGFGIPYFKKEEKIDLEKTINGINTVINKNDKKYSHQVNYILELGRYIVGEFGYYITKILTKKISKGKTFVVVDGGMHQNLQATGNLGQVIKKNYKILNLTNKSLNELENVNITGCLCTPIDLIALNIKISKCHVGDLLAIMNSGAYGYTASPLLFLGHDTPKEILIKENDIFVIREKKDITSFN